MVPTVPHTPCGVLNLNKPTGMTSRAVVDRVARAWRRVKVGHAGTLDPLATGVLVIGVGAATRLIEHVQRMPKTYRAIVRLDAQSDTLDADGQIREIPDALISDESAIRAALAVQVGTILQRPPAFSALKIAGRRAYDLARAGRAVEPEPRPVRVDRIDLLSYAWPRVELEIECGGGTYIRAIARDLGDALGSGGLVEVLTRTRIGPFHIADALGPETLTPESIPGHLRPAVEAVAGLPRIMLTAEQVARVGLGQALPLADLPAGEIALIGPDGRLVAVAESDARSGLVHPRRVLVPGGP
jgi:tRNA pseudouridine55 synthase